MKIIFGIIIALAALMAAALAWLIVRFRRNRQRADETWVDFEPQKLDIGAVRRLTVTPLIDYHTASEELVGEPGVSYLIEADDTTILFDVGYNMRGEHPSPLLRNMQTLGVKPEDIDYIVISHLHLDHVGGMAHQRARTFALSAGPVDGSTEPSSRAQAEGFAEVLSGVTAYVPEPMSHPTARVEVVEEPKVIATGVASEGPIHTALFFLGWTPEQALAVNVAGKGIVLIVGCGHQGVRRIVERAEALFDAPLYGLIGGLHYPVTASRETLLGIPVQHFVGTGRPPWSPIRKADVEAAIAYLKEKGLRLVGLSPHDSCDWSLEAFRRAFGSAYREVRVGNVIKIQANEA